MPLFLIPFLPVLKRWAVMLALGVAFMVTGYVYGLKQAELNQAEDKLQQVVQIVRVNKVVQSGVDDVAKEVVEKKAKIETVYKYIDREVIKYVQENPSSNDVADPQWVSLYNAAALACDYSDPTCRAQSDVAGDVTNTETLSTSTGHSQAYQECRIQVEGLKAAYEKVRSTINDHK